MGDAKKSTIGVFQCISQVLPTGMELILKPPFLPSQSQLQSPKISWESALSSHVYKKT